MANTFNNFFTNVGKNLDKSLPDSGKLRNPSTYLRNRISENLLFTHISPYEIKNIIKDLDESKSTGPSSLPTKILKNFSQKQSHQFLLIYVIHHLIKVFFLTKTKLLWLFLSTKKIQLPMLIIFAQYLFYQHLAKSLRN